MSCPVGTLKKATLALIKTGRIWPLGEKWARRCPDCAKVIEYKRKPLAITCENALKRCQSCSGKGRHPMTPELKEKISVGIKRVFSRPGFTSPMLGRSPGNKGKKWKMPEESIQKALRTKAANGTLITAHSGYNKTHKGWVCIGGKRFFARSSWETGYATFLELQKRGGAIRDWGYEPKTFWFEKIRRGVRSYTPDFKVTLPDGSEEFHEVKGYMDQRSKTKLKRMRIYYPSVRMVLVDGNTYKSLSKKIGNARFFVGSLPKLKPSEVAVAPGVLVDLIALRKTA